MKKLLCSLSVVSVVLFSFGSCKEDDPSPIDGCLMLLETSEHNQVNGNFTSTVELEYDHEHNLTAIILSDERHRVTLDDRGNVIKMVSDLTLFENILAYDADDHLISRSIESVSGNQLLEYTYNASGQVATLKWTSDGQSTFVWNFTYEYPDTSTKNPSSVLSQMEGLDFSWVHTYTYDNHPLPTGKLNRLLFNHTLPSENNVITSAVQLSGGASGGLESESEYTYNDLGYPAEVSLVYSNGARVTTTYRYACE